MRAVLWLAKPSVQTWFNGAMTLLWLIMLPITLAFVGPFSTVLWVSFISAWALFATHLGAWIAALVNVKAERIERQRLHERLDSLHDKHDALARHLGATEAP